MDILKHFDYMSTGDILMVDLLVTLDSQVPADVMSVIDEFIDEVTNKRSVSAILEHLRLQV